MAGLGTWALSDVLGAEGESRRTTATARVKRVDGDGTVWVTLQDGAGEFPATGNVASVQPGDAVTVRVERGFATITGNSDDPSASSADVEAAREAARMALDSAAQASAAASVAEQAAEAAGEAAGRAIADAATAKAAAESVEGIAQQAAADASAAATAAGNAVSAASKANYALSDVEKVVGTLNWIAEHGEYVQTQDTAIVAGKVYYTRSGTEPDYTYSVVAEPVAEQLPAYYELSLDESVQQYLAAHLWLDDYGLNLSVDSANGYRIHQGTVDGTHSVGTYILDPNGVSVASFGADGARVGQDGGSHISLDEHGLRFWGESGEKRLDVGDIYTSKRLSGNQRDTLTTKSDNSHTLAVTFPKVRADGKVAISFMLFRRGGGVTFSVGYNETRELDEETAFTCGAAEQRQVVPDEGDAVTATVSYDGAEKVELVISGDAWESLNPATDGTRYDYIYDFAGYTPGYILGRLNDVLDADCDPGMYSVTEGYNTFAGGAYAHAEGDATRAFGTASHGEGQVTDAEGDASHSEGVRTRALATAAHAEGISTRSSGVASHTEGEDTIAGDSDGRFNSSLRTLYFGDDISRGIYNEGYAAHAEGQQAEAVGIGSHAGGLGTVANGNWQTVIGLFNEYPMNHLGPTYEGTFNPASDILANAFVIGNGTSESNRSNAFAVTWGGVVKAIGAKLSGLLEAARAVITKASGDTSTNALTVNDGSDDALTVKWNGDVDMGGTEQMRSTSLEDATVVPSANKGITHRWDYDGKGQRVGYTEIQRSTTGVYRSFGVENPKSGAADRTVLYLDANDDGTRSASLTSGVAWEIKNGGTGATTAAGARTNLGANSSGVWPLTLGGTGATSASAARTNLGLGSFATKSSLTVIGVKNEAFSGTVSVPANSGTNVTITMTIPDGYAFASYNTINTNHQIAVVLSAFARSSNKVTVYLRNLGSSAMSTTVTVNALFLKISAS